MEIPSPIHLLLAALFAAAGACSPDSGDRPLPPAQTASQTPATASAAAPVPQPDSVPLDTLLARIRSHSPETRAAAALALSEPGPRHEERLRALAVALHDSVRDVSLAAARSLTAMRAEAVPTLVAALSDEDAGIRRLALSALGRMGRAADVARPAVRNALSDPNRSVRDMAARAMRQIGPQASRTAGGPELGSTDDLRSGLSAPDAEDRLDAIKRFQPYATDPVGAVKLLVVALGDKDPRVRAAAADALVSIGPPSRVPLTEALSDSNPVVRQGASVALVRLGRAGPGVPNP